MTSIENRENNLQGVSNHEDSESKERLQLTVAAITLSGPSGTGKTSAAKILEQRIFEITETRIVFIKAGELFREKIKETSGQEMLTYAQRDSIVDNWIDEIQAQEIRNSSLQHPLLLEGRLAGIIAREQKSQIPDLTVLSVLFTAHPSTRYLRILRREREGHPNLTFEDIRQFTTQREQGDLTRWRELHPQLRLVNPFSPRAKDVFGNPIYDLVVNTSQLTVKGVADFVINHMVENGYLRKPQSLPNQGQIFPTSTS